MDFVACESIYSNKMQLYNRIASRRALAPKPIKQYWMSSEHALGAHDFFVFLLLFFSISTATVFMHSHGDKKVPGWDFSPLIIIFGTTSVFSNVFLFFLLAETKKKTGLGNDHPRQMWCTKYSCQEKGIVVYMKVIQLVSQQKRSCHPRKRQRRLSLADQVRWDPNHQTHHKEQDLTAVWICVG